MKSNSSIASGRRLQRGLPGPYFRTSLIALLAFSGTIFPASMTHAANLTWTTVTGDATLINVSNSLSNNWSPSQNPTSGDDVSRFSVNVLTEEIG